MVKRDLMEKLERIEYLLEYLSREIETIKRVLGIGGGIFTILEGGIETYKTATSEYKRIISFERMIRNMKMDNISKEILRILAYMGPLNITQITMELKRRRGKASRLTVTQKLKKLMEIGIVTEEARGREKLYHYKTES
ncbi:MAG: hypothetical protein MRT15_05030 [archaeon YNP-LCB-003-016]|jgi:DNA-binding transcriptional ArsR family regulator|uniref:hypothetical protein n=1 Tax=Candidatus Culexarchaeum yellowstonense TaxID=2928963 RepID=UPI0026F28FB0|nr:hypothetical protein [Candidatus Culexarchaeum yellowstonense]MCR6691730.1 hypothetical protein [Candidatus Culexarchaeum yellowstonense]